MPSLLSSIVFAFGSYVAIFLGVMLLGHICLDLSRLPIRRFRHCLHVAGITSVLISEAVFMAAFPR